MESSTQRTTQPVWTQNTPRSSLFVLAFLSLEHFLWDLNALHAQLQSLNLDTNPFLPEHRFSRNRRIIRWLLGRWKHQPWTLCNCRMNPIQARERMLTAQRKARCRKFQVSGKSALSNPRSSTEMKLQSVVQLQGLKLSEMKRKSQDKQLCTLLG